jgi:hypothetical protein
VNFMTRASQADIEDPPSLTFPRRRRAPIGKPPLFKAHHDNDVELEPLRAVKSDEVEMVGGSCQTAEGTDRQTCQYSAVPAGFHQLRVRFALVPKNRFRV